MAPSRPTFLERFRFFPLLANLIVIIVLSPVLERFMALSLVIDLLNGALFLAGIFAISPSRRHRTIAGATGLVFLGSTIAHRFGGGQALGAVVDVAGTVFLSILIYDFCAHIVRRHRITVDVISGAIAVYLMMAALWAYIYDILRTLDPDSFNIPERLAASGRPMLYFSLVTLTTLGYGDISPVSPMARSWVVLEALVGQIYLVVVVAMLVGMFVSQKIMEQDRHLP